MAELRSEITPETVPDEWVQAALRHYSMHGAGLIRNVLAGVAPLISAAERQRVYDELGRDHYVIFTADRWTVEHSVECRLSGQMHQCKYHAAVDETFWGTPDPDQLGRWRITGIDGEGMPDLERAEPAP